MSELGPSADYDARLTFNERMRLRFRNERNRHRRCPECGQRGYGTAAPRWDQDPVAHMLGAVTPDRCPCCGKRVPDATPAMRADIAAAQHPTTSPETGEIEETA